MARKIALISDHASPLAVLGGIDSGGQNVYVANVAKQLALLGYSVDVFTRKDSVSTPEIQNWKKGIRVINVPAGPLEKVRKEDLLPHIKDFSNYVLKFFTNQSTRYDLVHANFWMSGIVAMDIKLALGIPFVITFHALGKVRKIHQGSQDGFPAERLAYEDQIISTADSIIAECPQDMEDLVQLYQADRAKIQIVPCGFDPQEFSPMDKKIARKKLKLETECPFILQLGRMVPRKGVDNVVRGISVLRDRYHIRASLLIVGGESARPDEKITPELGRLKSIAHDCGVTDQVMFFGRKSRNQLKYYYNSADVFVSTPWYEPFGITPLESMACGTPVIGSKVGGIQYSVKDGETGFLIPPNSPEVLADRLAFLFTHLEVLEKMGEASISRANELFTWEYVANLIQAVYENVIAENQSGYSENIHQFQMIDESFQMAADVFSRSRLALPHSVLDAANILLSALNRGNKIMVCGNGGSAADSQHFAAELVGKFVKPDRQGLPVMSLTADSSILTAWANDISFEKVFSRQVEAFGQPGDVLVGISTTGCSQNLIEAFTTARQRQIASVGILGGDGGNLRSTSDIAIIVPEANKQRVQEVQIFILHLICQLIEEQFPPKLLLNPSAYNKDPNWNLKPDSAVNLPFGQNL